MNSGILASQISSVTFPSALKTSRLVPNTGNEGREISSSCSRGLRWLCMSATIDIQLLTLKSGKMPLPSAQMPDLTPSDRPDPQRLVIPTTLGNHLVGTLQDPPSAAEGKALSEVCILCHGFRSTKASGTLGSIAGALVEGDVSTFCFDFRGNGESTGTFTFGGYWDEVEDIRYVVTHLRALGRRVGAILGHSKGGTDVVLYAFKYGDVPRVVNVAGRSDLKVGIVERLGEEGMKQVRETGEFEVHDRAGSYRVMKQSLDDRMATDVVEAATKIQSLCRVLTVHGTVDETVPVEDAYQFHELIPHHKLVILENGDHLFHDCRNELGAAIVPFVKEK